MAENHTPLLLSKQDLCTLLSSDTMMISNYLLRKKFFTDHALSEIGISLDEYNTLKIFNYTQTSAIMKYFKIQKSELR